MFVYKTCRDSGAQTSLKKNATAITKSDVKVMSSNFYDVWKFAFNRIVSALKAGIWQNTIQFTKVQIQLPFKLLKLRVGLKI